MTKATAKRKTTSKTSKDTYDSSLRASEAERLKNVLLNNLAYEFRSPIMNIVGFIDIIKAELGQETSKEIAGYIQTIKQNSNRLNMLVEDIITVSLISSNDVHINLEPVFADQLIKSLVGEIFLDEWNFDLELIEDVDSYAALVNIDKKYFKQAILNILRNGLKYTHEGHIKISTKSTNDNYIISIKDTGIGIREESIPFIFDFFRQGDESLSRRYKGLGIGLAITKYLINQMNGTIDVKSETNKGSLFTVTLPLFISHDKQDTKNTPIHESFKMRYKDIDNNELPTVMIIDDDWANRELIQSLVGRLNLKYVAAESGEEALNLIKQQKVQLILVDISLVSGMSGIEFLKKIKKDKQFKSIPTIAVTAHAGDSDRKRLLEIGFDEYLAKPFKLKELSKVICRFLLDQEA